MKVRNSESWVACEMVPLGNSNPGLANRGTRKAKVPHGRLGLRGLEAHSPGNDDDESECLKLMKGPIGMCIDFTTLHSLHTWNA